MSNIKENIIRFIHNSYYEDIQDISNHSVLSFVEADDSGSYEYKIKVDSNFQEGISLRVDNFYKKVEYIKEKAPKDCDNVLIDISNKKIYVIEIKKETAFKKTPVQIFEQKEKDTKLFLDYFFMICKSHSELADFDFIYIRWKFGAVRKADRAYKMLRPPRVEYFKYDVEGKDIYKVERKTTLNLSDMFTKYELSSY